MRLVSFALLALLSACGASSDPAPTTSTPTATVTVVASNRPDGPWPNHTMRRFAARWTEAGTGWIFDGELILTHDDGRISGQIVWTLVQPDMATAAYMTARIGATGVETVIGTWSASDGRLDLQGMAVSDDTLISTDTYQLFVGIDGSIRGRTMTNDADWGGSLVGR